jgi:hypothetical protein
MIETKPNIISFVVGGTKRELAISFRQQKKGFRDPQPLDEEPQTVKARIQINNVWNEYSMVWDPRELEWIYRFTTSDYLTINPSIPTAYPLKCKLTWADGSVEYSPTEGTDFVKFYPNS